jgi:asparagine synthase (glutamine-hydrolysing)
MAQQPSTTATTAHPTRPTTPSHGFIAVSWSHAAGTNPDLRAVLEAIGTAAASFSECESLKTATWGLEVDGSDRARPLPLSCTMRRRERALGIEELHRLLTRDHEGLAELHPTFAAADQVDDDTVVAAADPLGFRHLYYGEGSDFAVLSTSARAVAACLGTGLDAQALALQSLLGWQIGQRTLFDAVHKLAPGELATLRDGRVTLSSFRRPLGAAAHDLDASVTEAAQLLRGSVEAFLDDHPDAVFQLTGGQDSRLLLSAVPPARRRGLRTLTLVVPGVPDGDIAAALSRRYGMRHEILHLGGLDELSPEEADLRCLDAARALECMADPLAHAALAFAEARAEPGPRVGGLGGEVARGFYYLGPVTTAEVTRRRVERLTRWRMFANESIPAGALDPEFATWARAFGVDEVYALTAATGRNWMAATDEFYLYQRMQRWAGIVGTAVCFERVAINPMLDDRFVAIARTLSPGDKRNSRFLSRLQVALDDELARIPLDGRPAPVAYATRSVGNSTRQVTSTMRKAARKAQQRAARANRPPAGGEILAGKVAEHWRANPAVLEPARAAGIFRDAWIEEVLAGEVEPAPSAVALVTNLRAAAASFRRYS